MGNRWQVCVLAVALCASGAFAQDASSPQASGQQSAPIIDIHQTRTIQAVNYLAKGSTKIDFRGTALLPQATGQAKIDSKNGALVIEANFDNLGPVSQFGNAYLVYVLWAITPEGRANNLGQLLQNGPKAKIFATTRLQNFGMIVTAEPYFAVTSPSEDVAIENIVRPDTKGAVSSVAARYELLKRGRYSSLNLSILPTDGDVPLDLLQARNAERIAKANLADQYASDSWAKAMDALNRAEDYQKRKQKKSVPTAARDAVQSFEDSITISVKRQEDERLANERAAAAKAEADAKAKQEAEAQARAQAEQQKLQAELAAAKEAQARAEAEKAQAEAEKAQAEAEKARAQALASQQAAEAQAQQERDAAAKAEADKQALRATLLAQFNRVLDTRDTPRGLVVNLGDVLFDTGKYDLKQEARERLAKLTGIVLAHPGLHLSVEGYTDNVGTEDFNQELSEKRAQAVRQYLIDQGLDPGSVTSQGFGMSNPVASNDTPDGRQKNRRVEIVISGEVIGVPIGQPPASAPPSTNR
jgi:outer membrane protein OmpA-like peptidoglycan-associated protein